MGLLLVVGPDRDPLLMAAESPFGAFALLDWLDHASIRA